MSRPGSSRATIKVSEELWRRALVAKEKLAYLGAGVCPPESRPKGHVAMEGFFSVGVRQVEEWIRAAEESRARAKKRSTR